MMDTRRDFSDEPSMSLPASEILIAADDPVILAVLGPKLQHAGFELLNALDGHAALRMARLLAPSLVLLDDRLPGISSLELCERLAQRRATAGIPVILLTALVPQSSVPTNVRTIIAKPFSAKVIVETIQAILAKSVAA